MSKLIHLLGLALLPALALASPVTPTRLQKRDSHHGIAFVGDTLNNLCKGEVDGAIYVVGLYAPLFGQGDACGAIVSITNNANQITMAGTVDALCSECGDNDINVSQSLAAALNGGVAPTNDLSVNWTILTPQ